jgi:hypothetical protein
MCFNVPPLAPVAVAANTNFLLIEIAGTAVVELVLALPAQPDRRELTADVIDVRTRRRARSLSEYLETLYPV